MKLSELIYPKQNPRRNGMHDPSTSSSKGDIIKCVKDLHGRGVAPRDILKHVKNKYGRDFLKVAEECLAEATTAIPENSDDLKRLKELFQAPLPVEVAAQELCDIIADDGLYDEFAHAEPGSDARPILRNWIELNMPSIIRPEEDLMGGAQGIFSPLHGYSDDEATVNPGNTSWSM